MTHSLGKYADFEGLREQAVALRREGLSLRQIRDRMRFRVSIHESADVAGAERFWAGLAGVNVSTFQRATLKRHNAKTVRKNIGEAYRGCLVIYVTKGADLYRRMEGAWYGIVLGAQ